MERRDMADIFISYAREDRSQAARLALALQGEGFKIWWDLESLRSGQSFNRAIQQALEQVKCVVVLWSDASVASRYVESEAYWAWDRHKLHSVTLDSAVRLPVPFNTIYSRNLTSWDGNADFPELRRLIKDIAVVAGAPKPVEGNSGGGSDSVRAEAKRGTASPAHWPEPLSGFRDPLRDGGKGPEMVVMPAGGFWMGSTEDDPTKSKDEVPRHRVEMSRPFALGRTPVTFDEYDSFAEATGKERPSASGWGRGRRPVINVDWNDALAYAAWLSEQTGRPYRLPTEAEWEYACRAGTKTRWSFGDEENDLDLYALYRGNSGKQSHPVGEKKPNPWGLHDVHGNVREWVRDCWHDSYEGAPTNGSPWQKVSGNDGGRGVARGGSWQDKNPNSLRSLDMGEPGDDKRYSDVGFRVVKLNKNETPGRRVLRGGSWLDGPECLRSVARDKHEPDRRFNDLGFRLAQDL